MFMMYSFPAGWKDFELTVKREYFPTFGFPTIAAILFGISSKDTYKDKK